jgi:hypothetical protein
MPRLPGVVGFLHDAEPAFVQHSVAIRARQRQAGTIRLAAVDPMLQVMAVDIRLR